MLLLLKTSFTENKMTINSYLICR